MREVVAASCGSWCVLTANSQWVCRASRRAPVARSLEVRDDGERNVDDGEKECCNVVDELMPGEVLGRGIRGIVGVPAGA